MFDYDFRQPVLLDDAPKGRVCEWCGKPAVHQLTALGGRHHNEEGVFCQVCAQEFARIVADSLSRVIPASAPVSPSVPV